MASFDFDVRIVAPCESAGMLALQGHRSFSEGAPAEALRLYREASAMPFAHASSGIDLCALGIALGDGAGARTHGLRALALAPGDADAWVNLGAACWLAGLRKEAAQATDKALSIAPGMESAALNLARMWRRVGQPVRARAVLAAALGHAADSARMHRAMAEICRVLGDTAAARRHALAALAALQPSLAPEPGVDEGPEAEDPAAQARLLEAMTDTCDRLKAAGIGHHLVGGVVLGIVRQGRPFSGDKDVDLGVDFDVDRALVAEAMADGFTAIDAPGPARDRRWCMGFVHAATGVGVDLFFKQPIDGKLRICLGWPDDLLFDVPRYHVGSIRWQGRDWPVPMPVEDYLLADYGDGWRSPTREVHGHRYDKRWHDSQLSSPSLHADSVPRAVNLGLLRLLAALGQRRWPKALALCDQLQALCPLDGVGALRAQLLAAGIR